MYHPHRSAMYYSCLSTDTIVVAATCDGAIILATDSRVTAGMMFVSDNAEKIEEIDDNVFISYVGRCFAIDRVLKRVRKAISLKHEKQTSSLEVACNAITIYKDEFRDVAKEYLPAKLKAEFDAEFVVAGWTKNKGGEIYYLPSDMPPRLQKCVLAGSGSIYLTGLFDHVWDERMNVEECKNFVIDAISIAFLHDFASGGNINLVMINSEGATRSSHTSTTPRFVKCIDIDFELRDKFLKYVASVPLPDSDEEDLWLNS